MFPEPHLKPLEIVFESAGDRELFSSMLHLMRTKASEESVQPSDSLPPPRIAVFCSTFNCSSNPSPLVVEEGKQAHDTEGKRGNVSSNSLHDWIPPQEFDVYFIGLQECKAKHLPEWQILIMSLIHGDHVQYKTSTYKYKVLATVSMWGIHGILVVKQDLARHFSHVHTDYKACGLGGVMGNKGAVGISCEYGDGISAHCTSFAFVNAHLAARAERVHQRKANYAEICRSLFSKKRKVQLLHSFDHLFWVGDLNYRINMGLHGSEDEFDSVIDHIKTDNVSKLSPHDQLTLERCRHNVFVGFREGELHFAPTYRLEYGMHQKYNNKRNQNPSWTDRVLWRSLPSCANHVEQLLYTCADEVIFSDHRPVSSGFSVLTSTGNPFSVPFDQESNASFFLDSLDFSCKFDADLQPLLGDENSVTSFSKDDFDYDEDMFDEDEESSLSSATNSLKARLFPQNSSRKNSYRRPMTVGQKDMVAALQAFGYHNTRTFTGDGFGMGQGSIGEEGCKACSADSSEFERYVSNSENGLDTNGTKICLEISANFLESSCFSSECLPVNTTDRAITYEWSKLPAMTPFIRNKIHLAQRCFLVAIRKNSKSGPVIGYGQIPLTDVLESCNNFWFAMPVLNNGVPAGILRGNISSSFKPMEKISSFRVSPRMSSVAPSLRFDEMDEVFEDYKSVSEGSEDSFDEMSTGSRLSVGSGSRLSEGSEESAHQRHSYSSSNSWIARRISKKFSFENKHQIFHLQVVQPDRNSNEKKTGSNEKKTGSWLARKINRISGSPPLDEDSKIRVDDQLNLDEERTQLTSDAVIPKGDSHEEQQVYYTYAQLKERDFKGDVDIKQLESYLSDQDFETIFKMDKVNFSSLAKWKRINLKKKAKLF